MPISPYGASAQVNGSKPEPVEERDSAMNIESVVNGDALGASPVGNGAAEGERMVTSSSSAEAGSASASAPAVREPQEEDDFVGPRP